MGKRNPLDLSASGYSEMRDNHSTPSRKGTKAIGFFLVLWMAFVPSLSSGEDLSPEEVARAYARALFARDFADAYRFVSERDRGLKPQEEYLQENLPFTGPAQAVAKKLSQYIEFGQAETKEQKSSRTVTLKGRIPDTFDPALIDLMDEEREVKDVAAETKARLDRIEVLRGTGEFPMREAEGEFELVQEGSGWKISAGWEEAVLVRFGGEVKMDLPWDFFPLQTTVRAQPGETLQVLYKVKNLSNGDITAKARHIIEPESARQYVNTIQCFCFIQTTLDAGEEEELPYVFQVDWDAPEDLKELTVRYEWYPIEHFQREWDSIP